MSDPAGGQLLEQVKSSPDMDVQGLLDASYPSMLIIEQRESKQIVIGVPHHAPAGISRLPCPQHEASDENTGHLGRYLAEKLQCCSIIACNYPIDVNKSINTDYALQLAKWTPNILVEIHAHSGNANPRPSDIEISCGSIRRNARSLELATKLRSAMAESREFGNISVNGDFGAIPIRLRATQTATIKDSRWIAYHLELAPTLRIPGDKPGRPPQIGFAFCDKLAQILRDVISAELAIDHAKSFTSSLRQQAGYSCNRKERL